MGLVVAQQNYNGARNSLTKVVECDKNYNGAGSSLTNYNVADNSLKKMVAELVTALQNYCSVSYSLSNTVIWFDDFCFEWKIGKQIWANGSVAIGWMHCFRSGYLNFSNM